MAAPVARSSRGQGIGVSMTPPIEFVIKQTGRFRRDLERFEGLWQKFKPVIGELEGSWWSSQGGGGWQALAESTIRQKGHSEILVDTGELKRSLIDPNSAMRIHGNSAEYGTDRVIAHFHQDGGSIPGRPPKRQVIPEPLPISWRQALEVQTIRWVNEAAARAYLR